MRDLFDALDAFRDKLKAQTVTNSCNAVNQAGDQALVGKPTAEGWKFTERKEYADAIRRLVEVSRGEGEIEFVELPAQITSPV